MCGCGGKRKNHQYEHPDAAEMDRRRTCAAMCGMCRRRNEETCTANMQSVTINITKHGCPLGYHRLYSSRVWWMGLEWYGVPKPLRVLLRIPPVRWAYSMRKPTQEFVGCGCVRPLKIRYRLFLRWRKRLAAGRLGAGCCRAKDGA